MRRILLTSVMVASVAGLAASASGQDSVPTNAGGSGNDALSPYAATSQRVRYIVDSVAVQTSWGNTVLIAPVLKASRDEDPLFRTLILGSSAASPAYTQNATFALRSYALWTVPGAGVHPTENTAAGSVDITGVDVQLGIAASEFGLATSSILGATVGLNVDEPSRLYVERTVALTSRASGGGADTATLSLGAVDAAGNIAARADNFGTDPGTATRVLGENLLGIATATRSGSVNSLAAFGGTNFASDAAATTYVVSNESVPTNTPSLTGVPGSSPFVLGLDFASRFRAGSTTANATSTMSHLAPGIASQRGNPTFSPFAGAPGSLGAIASLARPTGPAAKVHSVNLFDVLPGTPPTVDAASRRALTLPSPVSSPAYSVNAGGMAEAMQYLSQVAFRGGNGQVGLGRDAMGNVVTAIVVTDPVSGDVVVSANDSIAAGAWTIAAYPGMPVLNGPLGSGTGSLTSPLVTSAPAVDLLGNIYFVAQWEPAPMQTETGVFKSVPGGPAGHRLELLLTTGQQITGANSGTVYTISQLALRDGDSIASGSLHANQIIQQQLPGQATTDAENISAFGGLAVNAVITYDHAGNDEAYDAVLLILPAAGEPACAADFDNNGQVQVPDIFAFLSAWFALDPSADFDGNTFIAVPDIFAFLSAWFAGC